MTYLNPITLSVNPTYYCNFRCDFCYLTEEQLRDPHFMASRITQEQWKTLKSKLNKMLKEKE